MGKGASGRAGTATTGAGGSEHGRGYWEEGSHEAVEAVGDEECVQGRESLGVRDDERHHGYDKRAVGARLRARDWHARDVRAVRGEYDVVRRDEEDRV